MHFYLHCRSGSVTSRFLLTGLVNLVGCVSRLCSVYGITGNALDWFRSYLTGRIQSVFIEYCFSRSGAGLWSYTVLYCVWFCKTIVYKAIGHCSQSRFTIMFGSVSHITSTEFIMWRRMSHHWT